MAEDCTSNEGSIAQDLTHKSLEDFRHLNIVKFLGKGAVGEVYLASTEDETENFMAVKTFSLSKDVAARSRREFQRELHFMQTLSHKHLVTCHFTAEYLDCLTIAMPFYEGGDLKTMRNKQLQDIPTITRNMLEVTLAVEYIHSQSVAHQDIKLNNVFLDGYGRAILGDFGHARTITSKDKTLPAGMMGGAKGYYAPERFHADLWTPIDPFKCDIYAIGVMCWLLVANDDLGAHVNYIERLRENQDLPISLELRSALESMLEPDPAKRATATEMVQKLYDAMES